MGKTRRREKTDNRQRVKNQYTGIHRKNRREIEKLKALYLSSEEDQDLEELEYDFEEKG